MNELNCKNCNNPTPCSTEGAVAITCSDCVTDILNNINNVSEEVS